MKKKETVSRMKTVSVKEKKDSSKPASVPITQCIGREERQWLLKHGKKQFIDFQDEELKQLRNYFDYLDKDKGGSISAEELEEPLISLGFAESREDVQALIDAIDDNGNGEIELDEFLTIIKSGKQGGDGPAIGHFFKEMITGGFNKGQMPIPLYISDFRRKMIIQSMIGSNPMEREKGRRIAQAFDKQMRQKKEREREEKGELGGDAPTIVSAAHIEELQAKLTKYLKRGAFKR